MSSVAAYLYMQEIQLTLLVAGTKLPFINFKLFAKGFLIYFPLCSAFSLLPFSFYLIRHKFKIAQYLIPYIIISIIVFFGIFPLGIEIQHHSDLLTKQIKTDLTPLSPGYFRATSHHIDYYISTNTDGTSEVLHIARPTTTTSVTEIYPKTIQQNRLDYNSFSDPLIFDVFGADNHLSVLKQSLRFLEQKMIEAYSNGFLSFFAFMSIGFALSSVIGLRRFAKWRLLNLMNMLLAYFGIILVNFILYSNQIYEKIPFLEPAKNWLPVVINVVFFLIFTTIGIVCASSKLDPNRESD